MPNIATVLKAEIARVARKEIRSETVQLRQAVNASRKEIAALKRRLAELERQAKKLSRARAPVAVRDEEAAGEGGTRLRFSASALAKQREKLGLSTAKFAALIGVSPASIHNWESGVSRPRQAQLAAIAKVRGLGKREALARVKAL